MYPGSLTNPQIVTRSSPGRTRTMGRRLWLDSTELGAGQAEPAVGSDVELGPMVDRLGPCRVEMELCRVTQKLSPVGIK